ncbi:MAG: ORF6N domain-containing protein [Treponema sp.]|nr:ORF6N domain-containing protein [Treponema sp.]
MAKKLSQIQNMIYEIRGQKVMLNRELAALYQVETKYLKRTVKRNMRRFPEDFMFQLTQSEFSNL